MIGRFLELYSFSRNCSLGALFGAVALLVSIVVRPVDGWRSGDFDTGLAPDWESRAVLVTFLVVVFFNLYRRFQHFFLHYLRELLAIFCAATEDERRLFEPKSATNPPPSARKVELPEGIRGFFLVTRK